MESVQRFYTKRLQGMWNKGYNDRSRLLNTHSLEYRRIYDDLILCFQQLSNGFNSQLVNTFIKSTSSMQIAGLGTRGTGTCGTGTAGLGQALQGHFDFCYMNVEKTFFCYGM